MTAEKNRRNREAVPGAARQKAKLSSLLVPLHVRNAIRTFRDAGYGYAGVFEFEGGDVRPLDGEWGEPVPSSLRESALGAARAVYRTREPAAEWTADGGVVAAHPIWLYNGGRWGRLMGCFAVVPPGSLRSSAAWALNMAKFAADQLSERISALFALAAERSKNRSAQSAPEKTTADSECYRHLVDLSLDLMFIADSRRRLRAVNRSIAANLGYDVSELIGRDAMEFVREQDRDEAEKLADQARVLGSAIGELCLVRKDGSTVPVEVLLSYDDASGTFCGVQRDVSERLRLQQELVERSQQLERQNAEVKAAMEERSRFFRSVSHELRAPVTAILGFAELALDDRKNPPGPEQKLALERIADSARRLLDMLNELLDLSKLDAGKTEITLTRVNLEDFLRQVAGSVKPLAAAKGLNLSVRFDTGLPRLLTDEQKLNQIIVNLISNAVKFTPAGEVSVEALRNGRSVLIKVSDTGIGIPEHELPHIFEEFYQGSRRTPGVRGTGLGLTIARRLARLLGGDIEVQSRVGEGSTFTVRLPISAGSNPSGQSGQ